MRLPGAHAPAPRELPQGRIEYPSNSGIARPPAEHYAGGGPGQPIRRQRRQAALQAIETETWRSFLLRIMTGLHLLTRSVADRMRIANRKTLAAREAQEVQRAIQRSLLEVTRELAEFMDEANIRRN